MNRTVQICFHIASQGRVGVKHIFSVDAGMRNQHCSLAYVVLCDKLKFVITNGQNPPVELFAGLSL